MTRVAVDSSGLALRAAIEAKPDLLRINRDEAADLFVPASASKAARLRRRPTDAVRWVVFSDGGKSFIAWLDAVAWRVEPPGIRARNPIGCGDAMLAGLLATLGRETSQLTLRFATAIAAADCESPVAGRPSLERARSLVAHVGLRPLEDVGPP